MRKNICINICAQKYTNKICVQKYLHRNMIKKMCRKNKRKKYAQKMQGKNMRTKICAQKICATKHSQQHRQACFVKKNMFKVQKKIEKYAQICANMRKYA